MLETIPKYAQDFLERPILLYIKTLIPPEKNPAYITGML